MYRTFIFNLGYAEEATLASLVVVHEEGHPTVQAGLESFLETAEKARCCRYNLSESQPGKPYDTPTLAEYLGSLCEIRSHQFSQAEESAFEEEGWDFFPQALPSGGIAYMYDLHPVDVMTGYLK